jgi:hypothetical protein
MLKQWAQHEADSRGNEKEKRTTRKWVSGFFSITQYPLLIHDVA